MRIESRLCHVSDNKTIVQVNGWLNDKKLGSTLAEGVTVEIAEDKAISRLYKRINSEVNTQSDIQAINGDKIKNQLRVELPKSDKIEQVNNNQDPSDWSNELTAIDSEIKRLKWSRDEENKFLEKNIGYNNRNKITKYSDILKYLSLLKETNIHIPSKVVNENINILIEESDTILRELSWDNIQGREFLKKEFNVSTRVELSETQLKSFVQKLKSIRNQYLPN